MAGTEVVENEVIEQDVVTQPTEQEVEQAEIAAAFTASFDTGARVDETPAVAETVENTEQAGEEVAAQAETEAPPEVKVGVTAEELTAMLAKMPKIEELETMTNAEIRKVHGKLGEFNRALQELQKNGAKQPAVKYVAESFKRLNQDYPELAELLAEDLNEVANTGAEKEAVPEHATAKPDENFDARVAQVKVDLSKEMQTNLLQIQHRDCFSVTKTDDFKVWMQTLPADDQIKLDDSWDAMYLGEKLTEFKAWQAKKQTGTQERKERLERAIVPKGTQGAHKPQAMTMEDGFHAAFKT